MVLISCDKDEGWFPESLNRNEYKKEYSFHKGKMIFMEVVSAETSLHHSLN